MDVAAAEHSLLCLDPHQRRRALELLAPTLHASPAAKVIPRINLHCHTFYSYNAYGHSPSSLAWLARQGQWYALGTVDFDVLDGVDETLDAAQLLALRACAGLETRAFLPDASDVEFNSPGEPGVMYVVGVGFASSTPPSAAEPALLNMRQRSAQRNRTMVSKINAHLRDVSVDYDGDVVPLTPVGNATERHILVAYDAAARRVFPRRPALVSFWAERLSVPDDVVETFLTDTPFPHDVMRAKLMKRGGPGYMLPQPDAFPPLSDVFATITACGAAPTYPFLDGTSAGEGAIEPLLERLVGQGVEAVTIIPERNWNIANPAERDDKVARLHNLLALARRWHLPVLIGTEMNRHGQRMVDDLAAAPLLPYRDDFRRGADWTYGHTLLQRSRGLGTASGWARAYLADRARRADFYVAVGRSVPPNRDRDPGLPGLPIDAGPQAVLDWCARLGA